MKRPLTEKDYQGLDVKSSKNVRVRRRKLRAIRKMRGEAATKIIQEIFDLYKYGDRDYDHDLIPLVLLNPHIRDKLRAKVQELFLEEETINETVLYCYTERYIQKPSGTGKLIPDYIAKYSEIKDQLEINRADSIRRRLAWAQYCQRQIALEKAEKERIKSLSPSKDEAYMKKLQASNKQNINFADFQACEEKTWYGPRTKNGVSLDPKDVPERMTAKEAFKYQDLARGYGKCGTTIRCRTNKSCTSPEEYVILPNRIKRINRLKRGWYVEEKLKKLKK